ncbi:MAG: trypsin-like serine protease [Thermoleophilaceae bacterium]|nr:trypsin-like serine protease [Thermoleophilaceae bacterium]
MAFFALLATTLAFSTTASADPTTDVIGGTNVSHSDYVNFYPFMVGLLADADPSHQFCGGSLIASQWVMTAAHCYAPEEGIVPKYVHIGSEDMLSGGEIIPVAASIIHPAWNPDLLRNDIQLIKLKYAPTLFGTVTRSTAAEDPVGGEAATLIGWGKTASGGGGSASQFLKSASVDVVAQNDCQDWWNYEEGQEVVTGSQICAIHEDTGTGARMACNGDSGGPLLYNNKVIGIASFVYIGCYDYLPNVYTRVSSFNGWIDGAKAKTISPEVSDVSFGSVDVASGAAERTIKFRSDGDQTVNVSTGAATGDFAVKASSCNGAILSGAFCQVVVTFDPTNTGARGGELVVSSDSTSGAVSRVRLSGFGTGKSTTPISLRLTLPHASKVKGKKLTAKFRVGYAFPAGSSSPAACSGLVRLSLKVPKLKKPVFKTAAMAWTVKGCAVTIVTSMKKAAKGRKAKATVSFAGNNIVGPAEIKKTIRIR